MAFNKAKALQEAEKSVSQGKTWQAIRQYQDIFSRDPSDLAILNTIGDLYVREKNLPEGLKQFNKLAEAYLQEGFTVKAIAIYKKISKLEPNTVEPLVRLAELYQLQGLGREAREQYVQAGELYKKRNQNDKAAELLRKIVQLDPGNAQARARLAAFCDQIGRKDEAAQVYVETAEVALRRGDAATSESSLKRALELKPKSPKAHLLLARLALARASWDEVEEIIAAVPDLRQEPAAKQLLLQAYLAAQKVEAAESLVLEVYRAGGGDFTPLASFSALCLERGDVDAALEPLANVADELIEKKDTAPLMEALRRIWNKAPQHLPTLELIYLICERTADEFTIPEVLEALGHAYLQTGELAQAELAYQHLVKREPENEHYKGLLKQVQQKQGKEVVEAQAADLAREEVALSFEPEAAPAAAPPVEDAEQAAIVKEALENSDLFTRYRLPEKALAELDKVLTVYPDQVDIHKRILEICRKDLPERAAQAASALARIFAQRGDAASTKRYQNIAAASGAPEGLEVAPLPAEPATAAQPPAPPTPRPSAAESDLTTERAGGLVEATAAPAPPVPEVALDLRVPPPPGAEPASAPTNQEVDLSEEWESAAAAPTAEALPPAPPTEAAAFDFQESSVEIEFYLVNGFEEEAEKVVQDLESRFPGNPLVAELRHRVEMHLAQAAAPPPDEAAPPLDEALTPVTAPEEEIPEPWELPSTYASESASSVAEPLTPSPAPVEVSPLPPATIQLSPQPAPASPPAEAGAGLMGDLAGDLASSLEGLTASSSPPALGPAAGGTPASPLGGLLEEMGGGAADAAGPQEDPETHYNLGVAFREMGLLDEAIGEFQNVVKGAGKGNYPPHFLQVCSLLALSFMDKKMPAVAVKWYLRALEAPELDEEATLSLQYDLGAAYEMAGDMRTALEKFTEVYGQNIDFRDVAEKIRLLQQKVT